MTLVKYGIASVFVASAALLACGGSSGDGGGPTAGSSHSSAGASSSSAGNGSGGSKSPTGGGANAQAGGAPVGAGGACNSDPNGLMCPAAVTCVQNKCPAALDTSTTGVCGSYVTCANACNCDQTCLGQCPQTTECTAAQSAAASCIETNCLSEFFSCLTTGSGGAGSGGKTCADLSACCDTLTDADQKTSCTQAAGAGIDFACSFIYSQFCG